MEVVEMLARKEFSLYGEPTKWPIITALPQPTNSLHSWLLVTLACSVVTSGLILPLFLSLTHVLQVTPCSQLDSAGLPNEPGNGCWQVGYFPQPCLSFVLQQGLSVIVLENPGEAGCDCPISSGNLFPERGKKHHSFVVSLYLPCSSERSPGDFVPISQ